MWNRNLNIFLSDEDDVSKRQIISAVSLILRVALAKKKHREYGFITLYTDGNGNYWQKVSRGFSTALNENLSSLETLVDAENI